MIAFLMAGMLVAPPAQSLTNPFQRGPDPTEASVTADSGPFAIAQTSVSRSSVSGFGGGTIYYPTSTAEGTFGAAVVTPGFTETQSAISWYGPHFASQGFVIFTIDTSSTFDQPTQRASEMLAALDYLTQRSSVRDRIDASRLGLMGHSMGGGGTLEASVKRPALKAAVPLAPWDQTKDFSADTVPTLIVGAQNDTVAPVAQHAIPFYTSMTAVPEKAYLELAGADHFVTNSPNVWIQRQGVSWLKRFIDSDTRYDQFLCPPPSDPAISQYRDTCPIG